MTQDKVVYLHVREDVGAIFYVGIGSIRRANKDTNSFWNQVI